MRLRRRLRKLFGWGAVLLVAVLVGAGWFAWTYVTDNETLRAAIREGAPRFLPGCLVDVQRVRVRPIAGEVVLTTLSIRKVEERAPLLVASSPWVQISYDPWAMLDGKLTIREVVVAQPRLRLRRRKDGTWNVAGLLADPWPLPRSETSPPVRIENGTIELVDDADGPDATPTAILRDVSIHVGAGDLGGTPIRFDGTAKGDLCDGLKLVGTVDRATGRVALAGDLGRLSISKSLGDRLPAGFRPAFRRLGLSGGELDLTLRSLLYDPKAKIPLRYDATARLRSGSWTCPSLPFALSELAATVALRDGVATVENAVGRNGATAVHAAGTVAIAAADPSRSAFRIEVRIDDLELDDRLRDWSIRSFARDASDFWADFRPGGRVGLVADLRRDAEGGPVDWGVVVGCRDVSLVYRDFPYPLEHIDGEMVCRPDRIALDLRTIVGSRPVSARGTIDRPGPLSTVDLDFAAESLPIDAALLKAMPPDVRQVVGSFKPAGTVRGTAHLRRTPPVRPGDDPMGDIAIDAALDVNPGSEITWEGLQYPIRDLTGHLEIHPTSWIFKDMKGVHGQAKVVGDGRVDRVGGKDQFKVGIHVNADNILFESQLRDALQPAWQRAWDTLNPTGASDVDVVIELEPGRPDHYHLEIVPRPQTNLRLRFDRVTVEGEGDGGPRRVEMPMEDVTGRFVFDNGKVTMTDGGFLFRNAPVRFTSGEVRVYDSGQFSLRVADLAVDDFRLDAGLRKLMPPLMAQFARKLDDGKTFRFRTDLDLAWSGKPGDLATCGWQNATVVFLDNAILAGTPLRHIQGQLDHLSGRFDGREFAVKGALDLGSINLLGLQITNLTTPIELVGGRLRLGNIEGTLIKGKLTGDLEVGLDATPRFSANLAIDGADLESYAKTLPGRQTFRGLVSAKLHLDGFGQDPHSLQGGGEAHVTRGDLGKLPAFLRVVNLLNLAPTTKTAFDKADVWFTVRNGETTFDPIQFFGYAFSLHGRGKLDVQGDLDVKLRVLYGRDAWHIFLVSDAIREVSGQIFVIRVLGTPSAPVFKPEPLPQAVEFARSFGDRERKAARQARDRPRK